MSIFLVFRLILFIQEYEQFESIIDNDKFFLLLETFFIGVRFDTVICGYLLLLPITIILIGHQLKLKTKIINRWIKLYTFLAFSFSFLISGIDIPYFHQFFSRFTVAGLQWIENPAFMFKMIFEEVSFWWIIIPISIFGYVFYRLNNLYFKSWNESTPVLLPERRISTIILSILLLGFTFLGIRGRIESKSPIRVGTAYFSDYAFLNQLGLNPSFTFLKSYLDSKKLENKSLQLLEDEKAIRLTKNYLNRTESTYPSITQNVAPDSVNQNPPNIVLVIMEGMSANKLGWFGNTNNLTPFLDSLSNQSITFNNVYSAGTHTFNGIYSTIFSIPALFTKHPMKGASIPKLNGIGSTLKNLGYSTSYFTTHDEQFDNVGGFLKANNFELIISEKDYPKEEIKSTLGVPDDYFFEFAIPKINELANKNKPFLSVMMTASDHGPYYIPPYFESNKELNIKQQIVQYADWSLEKFVSLAKKQPWFSNTIFAFIADHGSVMNAIYDTPLSYNHVPFIIFSENIKPKAINEFGGQIDVFPTLMEFVGKPYVNSALGINLFKQQRSFSYFCNDNKLGVINKDYIYIYRGEKEKASLYEYRQKSLTDISDFKQELIDSMKTYAFAQMQTAQYILKTSN